MFNAEENGYTLAVECWKMFNFTSCDFHSNEKYYKRPIHCGKGDRKPKITVKYLLSFYNKWKVEIYISSLKSGIRKIVH